MIIIIHRKLKLIQSNIIKVERLDVEEDVEGVEESTIDRDGEIAITAFNLKDEEEDGHFGKVPNEMGSSGIGWV